MCCGDRPAGGASRVGEARGKRRPLVLGEEGAALSFASRGIDAQEDKKEYGEPPKRRTTVAEERQRDTDDGRKSEYHADVND